MGKPRRACETAGEIHGFGYVIWRGVVSGRWLAEVTPPAGLKTVIGFRTDETFSDVMAGVCSEICERRGGLPNA